MASLGVFLTPDAARPEELVAVARAADEEGLAYVAIQDHPYQRRFLDTWTLLSYLAAATDRVGLLPDVANLPLRPPAVLAKSAASLDVLSGGRVELGLGAGAFWEGIEALGGPVRSPGESVDALTEAIEVIRAMWAADGPVDAGGETYSLSGAKPGPAPAHPIGIWLGAYGPRMLRLTGRAADGWLPSLPRLPLDEVPARQQAIDEAARKAGRDPSDIRRVANVSSRDGFLEGPASGWGDELAGVAERLGFDTFLAPAATVGRGPRAGRAARWPTRAEPSSPRAVFALGQPAVAAHVAVLAARDQQHERRRRPRCGTCGGSRRPRARGRRGRAGASSRRRTRTRPRPGGRSTAPPARRGSGSRPRARREHDRVDAEGGHVELAADLAEARAVAHAPRGSPTAQPSPFSIAMARQATRPRPRPLRRPRSAQTRKSATSPAPPRTPAPMSSGSPAIRLAQRLDHRA